MHRKTLLISSIGAGLIALLLVAAGAPGTSLASSSSSSDSALAESFERGTPAPQSMSVLAFTDDGTLFIADSIGATIFAIDTSAETRTEAGPIQVSDIEGKIAARLGTDASKVMVHDMAVHPVSNRVFLSVSRGREQWDSAWKLPNQVANADILLTVASDGTIEEFALEDVRFAKVALPNPVATEKKHPWMKELSLRSDTITDMGFTSDTLLVAGLSNEEFASTMWRVPLPFTKATTATTLEIYHGAHGEYETQAPIRTFVPYTLNGEEHILAAYLCTPLSLFKMKDLETKDHLRGRTIAEFGSGNYPLDMVVIPGPDGERLMMANSNLPLIVVNAKDIADFKGEIIERPEEYSAGVEHIKRSGTGVQQLDVMADKYLVMLQRTPAGTLNLGVQEIRRG